VTITVPGDVSQKMVEALQKMARKAAAGFTGSFELDLSEGVPTRLRVTECERFSQGKKGSPSRAGVGTS
jgi:hypothetical protein